MGERFVCNSPLLSGVSRRASRSSFTKTTSSSAAELLFPEIAFEQPFESLAVTGFVACHLMYGVVDRIEV